MASAATPLADSSPSASRLGTGLALRWRMLITLALLAHLAAVVLAPLAIPPSSPLAQSGRAVLAPYIDAIYLDHGYRFFAPDPGPSHLVRYELKFADGATREGRFPDLQSQWPRLIYHRHFMLSEKLAGEFPRPLPPEAPPEIQAERRQRMQWFERIAEGYARQLLRDTGAESVRLELVEHLIPLPQHVLDERLKLDDPRFYTILWQGDFEANNS